MPKEKWEQVTQAGKVEVDYLPCDPAVNEIAGEAGSELTGVYWLMGIAGAFALGAVVLIGNGTITLVNRTP